MTLFSLPSRVACSVGLALLCAGPAAADTLVQRVALQTVDWPASSDEADAYLSSMFNPALLASAEATELAAWAAYVLPGQATRSALDHAGPEGIDAVLSGLVDGVRATEIIGHHDVDDAAALFGVLFHPAVIDAVAQAGGAREAAWSAMVDDVEALYPRAR